MELTVDIPTLKAMNIRDDGISLILLECTEDDGKTFVPVTIWYNPAMTETDIIRVVQAEIDKMAHILHPSEIVSGIASTLRTRGKVYTRVVPVIEEEPIPLEAP